MPTVTLVYPYFRPFSDNSIFRFPPLGLGYIAAYLKRHGVTVDLVDCTFLGQDKALDRIRNSRPRIIGFQSVFSMERKSLELAKLLRKDCELLVAGGPLPTSNPIDFLKDFDIVVIGEGEETMLEIAQTVERGTPLSRVKGIAYKAHGKTTFTPAREFVRDLDALPFPARNFFDNKTYQNYYSKSYGYTTTSLMTSRGCPFNCDFCSRPVFGNYFRTRSVTNIVDEIEEIQSLGYNRVWFADDCFTIDRNRLIELCNEIIRRHLRIGWECLSRVDTVDAEVIEIMKQAGCVRVFFGIESGNNSVLALMKKQATTQQARKAVQVAKKANVQVGAFFIVGYPGESNETVLDTVKFASSLPIDYLSFTLPYPIPGTPLYDRVKERLVLEKWEEPKNPTLVKHKLMFTSSFSERKLKFAITKGMMQSWIRKYLKAKGYKLIGEPFERVTDSVFRHMR